MISLKRFQQQAVDKEISAVNVTHSQLDQTHSVITSFRADQSARTKPTRTS